MILSDRDIVKRCNAANRLIEPLTEDHVQPASYDVMLSDQFQIMMKVGGAIDTRKLPVGIYHDYRAEIGAFTIQPGELVLGRSVETFNFPSDLAGRLEGRSSLGRLGLVVHSTAGFFDPGFSGTATLEITNIGHRPIILYVGQRVAQMSFFMLNRSAERPYGHPSRNSKYQGQVKPQGSKIDQDA